MSLLQTGVVRERLAVQVVLTKLDVLQWVILRKMLASQHSRGSLKRFATRGSSKMLDLTVHQIASRPAPGGTLAFGAGLEKLASDLVAS